MTDDFLVGDGSIRVREPGGKFRPVETPKGFTDYIFRNVIAAADTAFRTEGRIPSVTEIQAVWPRASAKTISALVVTDEFQAAMRYRGIEWDVDAGLSLEQQTALLKLSDPSDRRMTNIKLRELGVPVPRFQAWLKQPLFAQRYKAMAEDNLKDAAALAINKLVGNVEAGDQRAIEKVLEITGRWDPANKQIEDVRNLVTRVMEAVIRNVPEKSRREAILADIQAVTLSYDLVQPQRAIEGPTDG